MRKVFLFILIQSFILTGEAAAQEVVAAGDSLVVRNAWVRIVVDLHTGKADLGFASGVRFHNTVAAIEDLRRGIFVSADLARHSCTTDTIRDPLGTGVCVNVTHEESGKGVRLIQYITLYENSPYVLLSVEGVSADKDIVETRKISPLTVLPAYGGWVSLPGKEGVFTDYPFDNDDWVDVLSRKWPEGGASVAGMSYELASAYDAGSKSGFVAGSLVHDFWKTGLQYGTGLIPNRIDSLIIYGGAATKDNPSLPDSYGGRDGTHDYMPHGTMAGASVYSPLIFLSASGDIRKDLPAYGTVLKKVNGMREWRQGAPVYWNSFGVEGVLGYEKVLMPADMAKISDYIRSLDNFNRGIQPVLSIDSYDQGIYSTEVLQSIGRYGKKRGQQIGLYFIPFALWAWKNNIAESKLTNTDHKLQDVILLDEQQHYIPYKDGDWGAFPIDPTHPYTRDFIVGQLKKAKAIGASFIKIDFLTAGALESARRYDPAVRTGIQAYNAGMKLLRHLVDSMLGPDIFITQAISPLFPNQYAHARFLSTDVYSHLRNDMPGFPHYGSTCAAMISASQLWWTQGNLWPWTNADVAVMKHFQKNPDLSEQEVKVRLYSLMTAGSILGDGSDFRDKVAMERGRLFLNNKAVCEWFRNPRAFTPIRFPLGNGQDQQLSYFLPGDTILVVAFNFEKNRSLSETFRRSELGLPDRAYRIEDFLTGKELGRVARGQSAFMLTVDAKDAVMGRLVPVD